MSNLLDKFVSRYGRLPTEFDPDYLEMLRMSKYRVLEVPDVQPGKCANCGASKRDGRSYVDFGLDVAWFGTVFLCSLCIQDIARNVGLFSELENKVEDLNSKLDMQDALFEQGKRLQVALKDTMEEVKYYLDAVGLHPNGNDRSADSGSVLDSDPSPDRKAAGESNRSADAPKLRAAKSASVSGPKDLLSLAERLKTGS